MNFDPSDFNVICALLGLLMSVYGLLAYLIRERCYLSDACRSNQLSFMKFDHTLTWQ
jgi:hypothetical protein